MFKNVALTFSQFKISVIAHLLLCKYNTTVCDIFFVKLEIIQVSISRNRIPSYTVEVIASPSNCRKNLSFTEHLSSRQFPNAIDEGYGNY